MSVIFINSSESQCGVHQYGLRMYTNLKGHMNIAYATVATARDYLIAMSTHKKIIINYHPTLFPFLKKSIQDDALEYYYIYHEAHFNDVRGGVLLANDPMSEHGIPRPLACYDTTSYPNNSKNPVIGSFGFGFVNKNFDKVVELVQSQFDKATIRLLMPSAYWGDSSGQEARLVADTCHQKITKPGIQLWISHSFLSNEDLDEFLKGNDLNMFLYPEFPGRGCSSVIDHAIGVNRPLAISDSTMFRHIYDDRICAYKTPLATIIENGPILNNIYREKWSCEALAATIRDRLHL